MIIVYTLFSLVFQLPPFLYAPVPPVPFAEFPIMLYVYVLIPLGPSQNSLYVYLQMKSVKKTEEKEKKRFSLFPVLLLFSRKSAVTLITHVPVACPPMDRYSPLRFVEMTLGYFDAAV